MRYLTKNETLGVSGGHMSAISLREGSSCGDKRYIHIFIVGENSELFFNHLKFTTTGCYFNNDPIISQSSYSGYRVSFDCAAQTYHCGTPIPSCSFTLETV
jgi:hypothetical protein